MTFFYKFKILILRIIGYEKPYRVVILKYLSLKFKTFRPHYETIIYESCIEAKKLGYNEVSICELGVAGGNGMLALEKYSEKIETILNIKIKIFGFDTGQGLPDPESYKDLPFFWKKNFFKFDSKKVAFKKSKIILGNVKDTIEQFIALSPKNIIAIFFDLDFYSSTRDFLLQIEKIRPFLSPRVYCYFDDVFDSNYKLCENNGELLAIKEFNIKNQSLKICNSLDNIQDFKFPLGKNMLWIMHSFNHLDYNKFIGHEDVGGLNINNTTVHSKIF
jgi:hypothetical protein